MMYRCVPKCAKMCQNVQKICQNVLLSIMVGYETSIIIFSIHNKPEATNLNTCIGYLLKKTQSSSGLHQERY